ncbi:MAG: hypothetical protein OXE04_05090 [bacterium]|nr:hypothetical protein [bacterium]
MAALLSALPVRNVATAGASARSRCHMAAFIQRPIPLPRWAGSTTVFHCQEKAGRKRLTNTSVAPAAEPSIQMAKMPK